MKQKQSTAPAAKQPVTVAQASEKLKNATEQLDESRRFLARDEAEYSAACIEFDNAVANERKLYSR